MKIEEKFNKRTAALVPVTSPQVKASPALAKGIKVTFWASDTNDTRAIAMHMTPAEAHAFAIELLKAAATAYRP